MARGTRFAGLTLAFVVLPSVATAQPSRERPSVQATRVDEAPHIDGTLDEAVWQQAPAIDQFTQQEPTEGSPPATARKCGSCTTALISTSG